MLAHYDFIAQPIVLRSTDLPLATAGTCIIKSFVEELA